MKLHPKLLVAIDGEMYVSGAGILILAARATHDVSFLTTPETRQQGQQTINALLSAARVGGFAQSDILETMLATDRESDRAVDLAILAVECIGGIDEFGVAIDRAGFEPEA